MQDLAPRSPTARALQRLIARTARWPPAVRIWARLYRGIARAGAALLTRGEQRVAVYARGGLATGDLVPGLSDIDLAIVFPEGDVAGADRLRRRWLRLRRNTLVGLLLDWPRIYGEAELRRARGSSALTYGNEATALRSDGEPAPAAYFGPDATLDLIRTLERPGLDGLGDGWQRIRGPELRAPGLETPELQTPGLETDLSDHAVDPIAAWLELLYWWRWAAPVCLQPGAPRAADIAAKLVAEPARIWLAVARGQRAADRRTALLEAREQLPREGEAIELALQLSDRLHSLQPAPLSTILPAALRLSAGVAEAIAARIGDADQVPVRVASGAADPAAGSATSAAVPPRELPLVDWRAVVCPSEAEERFVPVKDELSDPARFGELGAAESGPYPALIKGDLMVLPAASLRRSRMRSIKSRFSDPVSFALLDGAEAALFPRAAGWSAADWARRAVTEHRALLLSGFAGEDGSKPGAGRALTGLLTAARAALFEESVQEGEPVLALTAVAVAERLAERGASAAATALAAGRELGGRDVDVDPRLLAELRSAVMAMPAYRRGR